MGCDIHAVFQAKKNAKWVDVPSTFEKNRHYFLFAWLADVRNGYGFAGIPTHTAIQPISEPRGFPAGFLVVDDSHPTTKDCLSPWQTKHRQQSDPIEIWMGDHSYSWLLADEILAAERPQALRTGVVPLEVYRAWDGKSQPEEWSGAITGPKIVVSNPSEIGPKTSHVQIEWFTKDEELDYFIDEIKRLKNLHGEVRMVFGFDS